MFFLPYLRALFQRESDMGKIVYCIQSLRLRTLPLSVSGIILGGALAARKGMFSWQVFVLALLTTLSLQILSNLSNDLGDMRKGTDNAQRLGPARALQSGKLTPRHYHVMIGLSALAAAVFGISLIYAAFGCLFCKNGYFLLGSGALALSAAMAYTLGRKPYGYRGLGDLFVFLFFGLLSTCGSYFLMRPEPAELLLILLPASSIGFFSTAVLNVNNMRDMANDKACGKMTVAVRLGIAKAKVYHSVLIKGGWVLMIIYTFLSFSSVWNFLYLLSLPLFLLHMRQIGSRQGRDLDPQLRFLSISTLVFCILAAIGFQA